VLVAAGDPHLRQLIVGSLANRGYRATGADGGARTFTQVRLDRPDALVVDWSATATSGAALCSDLKSDPRTRDIRIVMMSDRTSESEVREGFLSGADDLLTSPLDLEELHYVLARDPAPVA
jgi:DNA-binding response OmpR family regulator